MKPRRLKANRFRTSRIAHRAPRPLAAHRFERLEARQLLAGDIQFRFEFADAGQNPVDAVQVGDSFLLRTFVQDIRAVPQGVSSAYMDFVYDNPHAMSSGAAIMHGADYATETSGDAATFPRIEDVGGGLTGGIAPANPDQEFLLFSLPLVAMSAGTFSFHPEMADGFGRDILLVGSGTPVPFDPENVMLVGDSTLQILPTVSFEQSTSVVDEGAGTHTVNVQLDTGGAALAAPVTVMVSALASSTAGGGDFTLDTSSITFPAASTGGTQPVSLTIMPDATSDGNLNVDLGLSVASDAAAGLGHLDRHRAKIIDDDFDRVEVEVNLYADHNGVPGVVLTEDTITAGNRFFVELLVGDYRDDPAAPGEQRGVIGMRVNQFAWPSANLVTLDEFPVDNPLDPVSPNPLVTSAFPLSRSGNLMTLSPTIQAIQNLTGFSNPTGGEGTAIGINQPARFSLMHFVANQPVSPAVALTLDVDTATITLADNSAVAATLVAPLAVVVNSRPLALNNHFGVDFNSTNNLLNVLGNDTDPDADDLTITSVTASVAGATIAIVGTPGTAGHQVQYTPPAGFRGTDTFIYTIDDAEQLSCATAMVTVDVGPLRVEKATNAVDPAAPTPAEDADSPTGPLLALGTDVIWTYQVFNEGTRPLTLTGIVDDSGTPLEMGDDFTPAAVESGGFNIGDTNQNSLLDPGEVWRFTSQGVISYQVVGGQYSNLAMATATAPDNGDMLSGQDPSSHLGVEAQVMLIKRTNGQDANTPTGPFLLVGSTAMFTYEVSNPGNVRLQLTSIVDDNGTPGDAGDDFSPAAVEAGGFNAGDTNQNSLIDPGETWQFSATRLVTAGQYTNTASVSSAPVDELGAPLAGFDPQGDTDPSNHFGVLLLPQDLAIEKQTNGVDADDPTGPLLAVGATATFTYQVSLAAGVNIPLDVASLIDDNGTPGDTNDDFQPAPLETGGFNDGDTNQNGLLDAGETWLFADSRIVTAGQYTNTAVVTANPVDAQGNRILTLDPLAQQDASNHFGVLAVVELEKQTNLQDADTPPGPSLQIGSTATFTYLVGNGGNVPLEFVSLIDDNGTPGDTGDDFSPAPVLSAGFNIGDANQNNRIDLDETWQFTASRVVTAGQYANVGTVLAHPVDEQGNDIPGIVDVMAQDASHHVGTPIRLEKATNAADPASPTTAEDADTAPGVFVPVGSSVVWTYLVFNDGTEPLDITSLVDDFGTPGDAGDDFSPAPVESGGFNVGDTNQDRLLDPGEAWQFTSSGVVNYLAVAGQYTNSAVVTADLAIAGGTVSDDDPSNHFGAQIDVDDLVLEKLTDGQDADIPPGPLLEAGTAVVFTYQLSLLNSANIPVSLDQLVDDNGTPGDMGDDFNPTPVQTGGFNNGDTNQNGLLDAGETWLFQAMSTVTPGQYTNTATADVQATSFAGQPIAGIDVLSASDSSNHFGIDAQVALVKRTNGQDANTAPGPFLAVGGTAMFSYEVSNPGNVPLEFVELVDDNGTPGDSADDFAPTPLETGGFNNGDTNQNGRIDPGETWVYQAMRTITAGQYTNTAVVIANPLDPQGGDLPTVDNRTASDVSNHFGAQGAVQLVKLTESQDANTPPGAVVPVGSQATFLYEVSIPAGGNVPLVILQLIDDNGTPGDAGDDFSPAPLETGGFNNGDTNQNGRLDLTETWLFQATRNPVTVGQYTNSATVSANPVDPQGNDIAGLTDVADSDASNHFGAVADGILVQKQTNNQDADTAPGPFLPVGGTATFTYQVSLPASVNVPIAIIALTDDNGTPANPADDFTPAGVDDVADGFNDGDTNQDGFLDPGETWLFRATRTVTAGQYTNTVAVTGNPVDFDGDDIPGLDNVTDSDASNHFGAVAEGIVIEKATNGQDADTAPGPVIAVGGTASFSYQVSLPATANVPVVITTIVDDNGTPGNAADDISPSPVETGGFNNGDTNQNDLLDPGETWLFQASRTVTAGQFTNIGRVTGNPVDPQGNDIAGLADVTDTDPSNHFGGQLPAIQLRKLTNGMDVAAPPGPDLVEGTTATFTYEVSIPAPGNVPVTVVSLTDDNGTAGVPGDDLTPTPVEQNGFNVGDTNQNDLLDPGETWQFQATRTVTLGAYTNVAAVTVNPVDFAGADVPGLEDRSATDSSSHTGILANSSLAGSAYIDANNNGMRDNLPGGGLELGLPDVRIVLLNQAGMIVAETRTDDSGNFNFEMIAPGTYDLVQSQPTAFIDGMTTPGSLGGTSGENIISQITVPSDADGTAYLFGERGIQPQFISKRMFLASSPPVLDTLRMLVGAGEAPINAPLAAGGGGGEGESSARLAGLLSGNSAGEGESLLDADDRTARWRGEGEAASVALAPVPLGAAAESAVDELAADSAPPRAAVAENDVALAAVARPQSPAQNAWEFALERSDQLAAELDRVFDPDANWLL